MDAPNVWNNQNYSAENSKKALSVFGKKQISCTKQWRAAIKSERLRLFEQ